VTTPSKRPTIADIAAAAGVSKGAVSYALNGKPGVSPETRRRIREIAARLGWHPSSAARALSEGRADAIGLVVDRPAWILGVEPFFMQLVSGIESRLSHTGTALVMQSTESADPASPNSAEARLYRRWWGERRVDGVLLVDLRVGDTRPQLAAGLGMPAVVVGQWEGPLPPGVGAVWVDDGSAARDALDYLVALGHRRIARVAGPGSFLHVHQRGAALAGAALRLGIPEPATVCTDYTGEDGARATRRLLSAPPEQRPTAIVYDNDVMAVAALGVAQEMGVRVPAELSLLAWDDSALCRLVHPALTAVDRDVPRFGARTAEVLLELVDGAEAAPVRLDPPRLAVRGSTAPLRQDG